MKLVDLELGSSHTSQIDNPGWKAFPVNVSLNFPTTLEHNFEVLNYQVFVEQVTDTFPNMCASFPLPVQNDTVQH